MHTSITLLTLYLFCAPVDEPEWGGFRGNNGAGIAESKQLPEALDPEHGVRWRTEVPRGYSSPVVAGGSVFLTGADGEKLWTLCIDRGTGVVRWRKGVEFDGKPDDYFASPVAAAGKLICASKSGQLAVIRADADWEVLSVHDLGEEVWSTPAIAGGQVFVRSQAALYCFAEEDTDR